MVYLGGLGGRAGADPGFFNRGEPNNLGYRERGTNERSEYKSAGGTGGAVSPPRIFFEFRTPESESERNLTNYFIIFLLLFVTFLAL